MLEGLDDSQMSTLAQAVELQHFQEGDFVVKKGDVGSEMFVIKEGSVVCKVLAEGEEGTSGERKIKHVDLELGPGKFFGERALMYHELRAADVIATSTLSCYTISASIFNMILGSLKDLLENNMRVTLLKSLDGACQRVAKNEPHISCLIIACFVRCSLLGSRPAHAEQDCEPARPYGGERLRYISPCNV